MGVEQVFNGHASKWKVFHDTRRQAPLIEMAIWGRDLDHIQRFSDNIAFTHEQRSRLLWQAIQTDDIATFDTVLAKVADNDVNFRLTERVVLSEDYAEHTPLYFALLYGRRNIALRLAADRATDIERQGFTERQDGRRQDPLPLDQAAMKEDMMPVTAILASRTAELIRSRLMPPRLQPV